MTPEGRIQDRKSKQAARSRRWYLRNKERAFMAAKAWVKRNPEKRRDVTAQYRARNADTLRQAGREAATEKRRARGVKPLVRYTSEEMKERNRESAREFYRRNTEYAKERSRLWNKAHPDIKRVSSAKYRSAVINQVHPEASLESIKAFYDEAARNSAAGVAHEVDHIIPVSRGGWHHELNLQVLPAALNRNKAGNPFWQHPGYRSWRDVPPPLWPVNLYPVYSALI